MIAKMMMAAKGRPSVTIIAVWPEDLRLDADLLALADGTERFASLKGLVT